MAALYYPGRFISLLIGNAFAENAISIIAREPPGCVFILLFSRYLLLESLNYAVPRNFECFQLQSFTLSLKSAHRQCWLSVSCHSADRKCIHNIFLLFGRQKMMLVIASCWLAPLQSRSEWVLFSSPVLWVSDASPPCFGITAKHMHWNPSWSSVCQMIIMLQRVCLGPLYLFLSP